MTYEDRTFCISPNCEDKCGRKLTQEIKEAAYKWWGDKGAPISVGYFCGNNAQEVFKDNDKESKKGLE